MYAYPFQTWWLWSWSKRHGYKEVQEYWEVTHWLFSNLGTGPPNVLSRHPAHLLLAFNKLHHLEQLHLLHLLLGVRANANSTSHQACIPNMGQCMITIRTSMGEIFPLTSPTFTPSVTCGCSVAAGAVISGMAILEIAITQTKEGFMMAWVTSSAVGGGGNGRDRDGEWAWEGEGGLGER